LILRLDGHLGFTIFGWLRLFTQTGPNHQPLENLAAPGRRPSLAFGGVVWPGKNSSAAPRRAPTSDVRRPGKKLVVGSISSY